jgi:hypothetical protein
MTKGGDAEGMDALPEVAWGYVEYAYNCHQ